MALGCQMRRPPAISSGAVTLDVVATKEGSIVTDELLGKDAKEDCPSCGHLLYHHRPECGYRENGFLEAGGKKCGCTDTKGEE